MNILINYIKPHDILDFEIVKYSEVDESGYYAEMSVTYRGITIGYYSGEKVPTKRVESFYIEPDSFDLFDMNGKLVGKFGHVLGN